MNELRLSWIGFTAFALLGLFVHTTAWGQDASPWEAGNPIVPIPDPPLGIGTDKELPAKLTDFENPPTPERVRLGRWLFFDKRLSADNTIACATCHRPENAFSEPTPNSTGIGGQVGGRKAPSFTNQAWAAQPHFFWDGRAGSLAPGSSAKTTYF